MSNILSFFYIVLAIFSTLTFGVEVLQAGAAIMIVIQYLFSVLNLTASSSPIPFGKEITEHIMISSGKYTIPIAVLDGSPNFAFDSFMYAFDEA